MRDVHTPIILPVGGELKARAGWAVGVGLWAKGQRKAGGLVFWPSGSPSTEVFCSPIQVTLNPLPPNPPGLGEDRSQLHLGPSPHRAAPTSHTGHTWTGGAAAWQARCSHRWEEGWCSWTRSRLHLSPLCQHGTVIPISGGARGGSKW